MTTLLQLQPGTHTQELVEAVRRDGWLSVTIPDLDDDGLLTIAQIFGTPISHDAARGHLVSVVDAEMTLVSEATALGFHNEGTYMAQRPAFIIFYCVATHNLSGGETAIVDGELVFSALSAAEQTSAALVSGEILVGSKRTKYHLVERHPVTGTKILAHVGHFPRTSVQLGLPRQLVVSTQHLPILERIDSLSRSLAEAVTWTIGKLLVLDNYRFMHGRLPLVQGSRRLSRVICQLRQ